MSETIVHTSRYEYPETVERIVKALSDSGTTLFANIDQAAAAKSAGLSLRPTTLLVFGNPRGGTPIMDAFPLAALDLPLRLLIWEEGGTTKIAHVGMREPLERHGVTGKDALISAMDRALETLVSTVA